MATLTQAWTTAAASLPLEWELDGVALGPRGSDPPVADAVWIAWARGPEGQRATGEGAAPHQALAPIARRLAELRGNPTG